MIKNVSVFPLTSILIAQIKPVYLHAVYTYPTTHLIKIPVITNLS